MFHESYFVFLSVGQVVFLIQKGASQLIVFPRLQGIPLTQGCEVVIFPEQSLTGHLLEDDH
jgi:hypothetical protein